MATAGRIDTAHAPQSTQKVNSEILDRLPPQNLEAEIGVLGSLLLNSNLCDDVVMILRPEDFYADANQKLFGHIVEMHGEGSKIDTTLLVERLKSEGDLEAIGGPAYLAEIMSLVPVAAHAVHYAHIVRDKATLRSLIHASTEILRDAYDPTLEPKAMMGMAEEKIFAVNDQRSTDHVASIHDVLMDAMQHIDHRLEHGGATGIPTGFTELDTLTGGMHKSELIILAARPSMGKTALATNIVDYVTCEAGSSALFVSLEMAQLELAQRMLCGRGKIDGRKFRGGYLSGEDREDLVKASSELSQARLYIDDTPGRTITEIAACARRLKRRDDLGLIVIDYLQLIEPDNSRDPRQEQVAKIARRLKGMARELSVPVLCLAQLNRQAEATKDNLPRLSHLRESGAIEQDADVVMFVHREEYFHSAEEVLEKELTGKADLIISKQRNGPTGQIKLTWRQEYTKFENQAAQEPYDEFQDFN
jgi:replicative DNA helicase